MHADESKVLDQDEEETVFENLGASDPEDLSPPPPKAKEPEPEPDFGFQRPVNQDQVPNPNLLQPTDTDKQPSYGWAKYVIGGLLIAIVSLTAIWRVQDKESSSSSTTTSINSEKKTDVTETKTMAPTTVTKKDDELTFTVEETTKATTTSDVKNLSTVPAPSGSMRDYLTNQVRPAYKKMRAEQKRLAAEIKTLKSTHNNTVAELEASLIYLAIGFLVILAGLFWWNRKKHKVIYAELMKGKDDTGGWTPPPPAEQD